MKQAPSKDFTQIPHKLWATVSVSGNCVWFEFLSRTLTPPHEGAGSRRPSREVAETFSSINLEPSAEAQAKVNAARARERALREGRQAG